MIRQSRLKLRHRLLPDFRDRDLSGVSSQQIPRQLSTIGCELLPLRKPRVVRYQLRTIRSKASMCKTCRNPSWLRLARCRGLIFRHQLHHREECVETVLHERLLLRIGINQEKDGQIAEDAVSS